jgi:hypothetical protein
MLYNGFLVHAANMNPDIREWLDAGDKPIAGMYACRISAGSIPAHSVTQNRGCPLVINADGGAGI